MIAADSTSSVHEPMPPPRFAAALWRLRRVATANAMVSRFKASRLRVGIAAGLGLVFWFGLFAVFFLGFDFLSRYGMIAGPLIEMLFGLFFGSILIMLTFSTGIILFAGLFSSRETEYLLALPVPTDRIFAFKFEEAMFFSCWGFLLLATPLVASYGICAGAPAFFYPVAICFFLAFALTPGCCGALLCLGIALLMPRRKWELLISSLMAVVVMGVFAGYRAIENADGPTLSVAWVQSLLRSIRLGNLPFLPSQWITRGLVAGRSAAGLADAVFYLLVIASNSLAAYVVTSWVYRKLYRRGFDRVQGDRGARPFRRGAWLDGTLERVFFMAPKDTRVLLRKDVRVFFRDPVQWLQVLIFAGLLGFYFLNLGRVQYYAGSPYWRNLIGFFILAVMGLLLATFTSRFVFPMLSLEGRNFWLLGLSPISRSRILWGKFAFSAGGSLAVTLPLAIAGIFALRIGPLQAVLQMAALLVLCCGVSGISVGLGARFPDLRATDPSRIAAGFGGTLNLVASLAYIFAVIGLLALPCHFYAIELHAQSWAGSGERLDSTGPRLAFEQFRMLMIASVVAALTLGAAAVYFPMRMGRRAFEALEF